MASAGMLGTVDLYISERDDLTKQMSDILMSITQASGQTSEVMNEETQKETALEKQYGVTSTSSDSSDSTQYEIALQEVQDQYNLKLQDINTWEKELEVKKQTEQTQLDEVNSLIQSFQSTLKDNVKKDYTYGQSSSSS